ncbi:hypothetical protein ACFW9F_16250 [Streptomyces sp. NPDC059506]|uniref:hypothetical protein n=1 Tax=Streptomyces sp. NPDC059506 TaxID=3347751 RepID=UPI00369A9907
MINFDPTSPLGRAVAGLFRACKEIEDGDGQWSGAAVVDALSVFFAGLGIDPDGPVEQLDARPGRTAEQCAAGLYAALLAEAREWAGDGEEHAFLDRAQDMPPHDVLGELDARSLTPQQLHSPAVDALLYLQPTVYGAPADAAS